MAKIFKNKYLLTIATVIIFGLTIALGSLYAKDRIERNDLLNESDAVKFAYVDAGISPKTAPSYEAKLLKEDGIYVYKVVISSEDTRYNYTIAANNGEVISSESAKIAQNKKDGSSSRDTTGVEENAANINDSNKADPLEKNGKNIISNAKSKDKPNANKTADNQTTGSKVENDVAENDKPAKGKSDVKNVADNINSNNNLDDKKPNDKNSDDKNSNDNIDGKKASGKKASGKKKSKKNAVDNNRHHISTDNETNNTSSGKTSTVSEVAASRHYISMDKAKSITLKDAGFRPSFVTFEKALLKKDDGKIIYEIEFFTSTYEYEYEVDAYTGAILSKDVDPLSPSDKAEKVKEN
ncbi:MAG: PepSY domain-containing protein, partial [Lachnospiraceae bacterium]|nr:PepSY domain-containing protein [Lachnospiraceae bacterium]